MLEIAVPPACEAKSELPESVNYCRLLALSNSQRRAIDTRCAMPHATDTQEKVSKNNYVNWKLSQGSRAAFEACRVIS
jgi:hypothetical protein